MSGKGWLASRRGRIIRLFCVLAAIPLPAGHLPGAAANAVTYMQPHTWGAIVGGSTAGGYGAPVLGTTSISTTAPSGGGTLGARVGANGPETKLQHLVAFGGGEPLFYAKGTSAGGTVHMLVAVRNAVTNAHELWAWGANNYGQLGKNDTTATALPMKSTWTPATGEQILELAVGELHSLMLTSDGTTRRVYAWGSNGQGQLGIAALAVSSATRQLTPRLVPTLSTEGIVSVAAGRYHSAAVGSDGRAWMWGYDLDTYGTLGLPGQKSRGIPIKLTDTNMKVRSASVVSWSITSNVATLNTTSDHYFEVGDSVVVSIGHWLLDGTKTITKVTNTSFSYAAQSAVTTTSVTPNGTIAYSNPSAVPTHKSVTSNVARLVLPTSHNFKVGNVVSVAIDDPSFDGTRTVTATGTNFVDFLAQPNVSATASSGTATVTAPTSAAVTNRVLSGNTSVTLTVPVGHNFRVGNKVTVALAGSDPFAASFNGDWTLTAVTGSSVTYTVGSRTNVTSGATSGTVTLTTQSYPVSSRQITSNTATITIGANHGLVAGNTVTISGLGHNFDGAKSITAVNAAGGTISYLAQANVNSTPIATGTVTMNVQSRPVTARAVDSANLATITLPVAAHGFAVGNTVSISGVWENLNGTKTITAVNTSTGTVSFAAQDNVALQTLASPGTATVTLNCGANCPAAPSNLEEIAAGTGFTMARSSTSVFTWGFTGTNHYGRLGRGNTPATANPAAVTLPAGCVPSKINAGVDTAAVLCANSTIATWGRNNEYKLGANSVATHVPTPATVSGITRSGSETVTAVALYAVGGIALTSTGNLWSWGSNNYRLLGTTSAYPTQTRSQVAVRANRIIPAGSATITRIFANYYTSGIIDSNGVAWTWGWAGGSLTGRGALGPNSSPYLTFDRIGVAEGTRITAMDASYYGTVALLSDGTVWSWGYQDGTAVFFNGDPGRTATLLPAKLVMPFGQDTSLPSVRPTDVACGYSHCLVTTSNGSIYGWGYGGRRAVVPSGTGNYTFPTLIASGLAKPKIAAGIDFSLYVDVGASGTGGVLKGWGRNDYRQASPATATTSLGAFTDVKDMSIPSSPGTVNDIIAVAAGSLHAVALRANGTLMTFGYNAYGALGNGTTSGYYAEPTLAGGKLPAEIFAAGNSTFVRATDGSLHAWGYNARGILADGTTTNRLSPVAAAGTRRFTRLAFHGHHVSDTLYSAVGLTDAGEVLAWGSNVYGQLGRPDRPAAASGVNSFSATPVQVRTTTGLDVTGLGAVATGGWWSAAFSNTESGAVPTVPRNVAVTAPAPGQLSVTWTAPATPNDLVAYEIAVSRGGSVVFSAGAGASSTSATLSAPTFDVRNGAQHTVTMRAVNKWGRSDPSNSASATPSATPDAVRNLVAVPLVNGIRVAFDEPEVDGGSPVTSYALSAVPASGPTVTTTVSASGSTYSVDMTTDIVSDMAYTVTVTPTSAVGPGTPATSNSVVSARPSAPRNGAAVGRVGEAVVSWTAPAHDGGFAIQSYVVEVLSDGGATSIVSSVVGANVRSATVSGLTDGTAYDIRIRASHDVSGATLLGVWSPIIDVVVGRPAKVTGVQAQPAGSGEITVSWDKVEDLPGLSVGGYDVDTTIGATTTVTSVLSNACGATRCAATITSLVNASTYSFRVSAKSGGNAGPKSDTATATARRAPDAPINAEGSIEANRATFLFDAPAFDGGAPITGYVVQVVRYSNDSLVHSEILPADTTSFAVSGLLNGVRYDARIRARNSGGDSSATVVSVTPATTPRAPRNLRVAPGSIIVQWDAPDDDGGAQVSHYVISVTDSNGITTTFSTQTSNPAGTSSCTTASRSCTIDQVYTADSPETLAEMPANMNYDVSVSAVNEVGTGPAVESTRQVVTSQPSEPLTVAARGGYETIELCWAPPAAVPAGQSVTAYRISASVDRVGSWETVVPVASLARPAWCDAPSVGFTVTDWTTGDSPLGGHIHDVYVQASSSTDPDDRIFGMSSIGTDATPYTLPGAPVASALSTTATSATFAWSAARTNGSDILEYRGTLMPGGATCEWTSGDRACRFDDLVGNDTYTFTVEARNAAGWGPVSAPASVVVDATPLMASWGTPLRNDRGRAEDEISEILVGGRVFYYLSFDEPASGLDVSTDLRNAGTATGCAFTRHDAGSTSTLISAVCTGPGTLVAQIKANSVLDPSGNESPVNDIGAATVRVKDPTPATPSDPPAQTPQATTTTTTTTAPKSGGGVSAASPPDETTTTTTSTTVLAETAGGGPAEAPPETAQITVRKTVRITIDEEGFEPRESVRIEVSGELLTTVDADGNGRVRTTIEVAEGLRATGTLELTGVESGRTVTRTLATVGQDTMTPLAVSLTFLLLGMFFVRRSRRPTH